MTVTSLAEARLGSSLAGSLESASRFFGGHTSCLTDAAAADLPEQCRSRRFRARLFASTKVSKAWTTEQKASADPPLSGWLDRAQRQYADLMASSVAVGSKL